MQPEDQTQQTSVFYWGMFKDQKEFVPKQVMELAKVGITKVGSGGFFFVVGNYAGEIWGWGTTKYNRFGVGGPDLIPVPKKIPLKFKVNKISAGNWHTLVTDNQGMLFGVGHNKYGALGIGNSENANQFIKSQIDFPVSEIAAGDGFSIIISVKGEMYGAGHHTYHGHKSKDNLLNFKRICEDETFVKVSAGFTHSLAINQKGQVYSWGQGNFLQLGHGNKNDVKTPKKVEGISDQKVVSVSCTRGQKYAHSMAATAQGAVYTWGAGYKGKLGHFNEWSHADPADEPIPKLMKCIEIPVTKVLAGGIHSGIINKNGEILTFGCGSDGRIGHIQSADHRYLFREGLPRKIQKFVDYTVLDASFSYYHNICVATRNGKS